MVRLVCGNMGGAPACLIQFGKKRLHELNIGFHQIGSVWPVLLLYLWTNGAIIPGLTRLVMMTTGTALQSCLCGWIWAGTQPSSL